MPLHVQFLQGDPSRQALTHTSLKQCSQPDMLVEPAARHSTHQPRKLRQVRQRIAERSFIARPHFGRPQVQVLQPRQCGQAAT